MKSNSSLVYNCFLIVGDFVTLVLAFAVAYILRVTIDHNKIAVQIHAIHYLNIFLALLPLWILIFALIGLYSNRTHEKRFSELGRLFVGSLIGILLLIGFSYAFNVAVFPAHLVALYGLIFAFVFLVIFRNLARYLRILLYSYDIGINNVLLVGETDTTYELLRSLYDYKTSGYRIIGVVGPEHIDSKLYPNVKVFDDFDDAKKRTKNAGVTSIFQTELYADPGSNNQILSYAQANHIAYRFIPGNTELFVGNIEVELFKSQIPVIAVHQTSLVGWGRVVKRVFDLLVSLLFIIILSPIFILVGFFVFVFSPGRILYKQERITRFNGRFTVYKFRTMKRKITGKNPVEEFNKMGRPDLAKRFLSNEKLREADDPRIYAYGRFLRRFSLDELPQLFNVLRGDISLVGPRAIVADELIYYDDKSPLLLSVKTGITGLAQVAGGGSINRDERAKLDLYYVQNWSFWLDITILFKTLRVIFSKTGLV